MPKLKGFKKLLALPDLRNATSYILSRL